MDIAKLENLRLRLSPVHKELNSILEFTSTNHPDIERLLKNPDTNNKDGLAAALNEIKNCSLHFLSFGVLNLPEIACKDIAQVFAPVVETFNRAITITEKHGADEINGIAYAITKLSKTILPSTINWWNYVASDLYKGEQTKIFETREKEAAKVIDRMHNEIDNKSKELDILLKSSKELAADLTTKVYSDNFSKEATKNEALAKKWLHATIAFSVITILTGVGFFLWAEYQADTIIIPKIPNGEVKMNLHITAQKITSKILIVGLLTTSAIWCSRIYKALMHQSATNKHKSLSIETMSAFAHSANEQSVKDAIIHEAAKTVFGPIDTGYLSSQAATGNETDIRIIDLAKTAMSTKAQTG